MLKTLAFAAAVALSATAAQAAIPAYPTPGVQNPVLYSFTAASTGDLVAYFAGSTASFTEDLGLLVNGVDTGIYGLQNNTTALGASLNFGSVTAGDTLVFFARVFNTGETYFSDKSLNLDGVNHVYSTAYAGGDFGIPAGTFVAFEDLPSGGDFNYNDLTFVFTNVSTTVPEPGSWALLLTGFGLVGVAARRRQAVVAA